jgi:anti-sigma factor RsiW
MDCKYRELLNAYHDGELRPDAIMQLELHLKSCQSCAAELAEISEVSQAFAGFAREPLSADALAEAHANADSAVSDSPSPVLRMAGLLTALAASILIIASAWLREMPAPDLGSQQITVAPSPMPEWERVAMTLDTGPLSEETPQPGQPVLAEVRPAEARLADWMLQNLSR